MEPRGRRPLRRAARFLAPLLLLAAGAAGAAGYPAVDKADYATSGKCASCHQTAYKGWLRTSHAKAVRDAKKDPSVVLGNFDAPGLEFGREDVWYVIGSSVDQRYLKRIDNDYYVLPRTWSVWGRRWREKKTYGWQRKPYSRYCVGCHSVGFDANRGDFVEHDIGCESCHGPGARHAAAPTKENIVHPAKLPPERGRDICASCHVRGNDLSGEFFFPIGWKPGEDVSAFLVPPEKERKDGESNAETIARLWEEWKAQREDLLRRRCDVCGIPGSDKSSKSRRLDPLCMECHDFDPVEDHTRHKKSADLGCEDCHKQKSPEKLAEQAEENVHSLGFFRTHKQGCWDGEFWRRCLKCHAEKGEKWAQDTAAGWKTPARVHD
jgi:hypothetical protein